MPAKKEESAQTKKGTKEKAGFDPTFFLHPEGHIRDRIIIHESSKIPKEGQFISLNGYAFLAKPGVEIDIPRPVRMMLDTRIETETTQDDTGNSFTRNIPRITYTLVKEGVNEVKLPEKETFDSEA
jgi:hypothetical protein